MPEMNAINEYLSARRLGRRFLSEHSRDENDGYLPILERSLESKQAVWELSLGTHDVPLWRIAGTYTATRSTAFAGNFMPLLDEGTEFSQKWQAVYLHHMKDGISDPVKIYDYLGKFYVLEGNKRVSVMNFVEAYSIRADVIRLIPNRTDEPENRLYYELLDYDIKGMWFSDMEFRKPGSFSGLINGAKHFARRHAEYDGDRPHLWMPQMFRAFLPEYRALYPNPPLATGDAFAEYVRLYGFPHNLPGAELAERLENCAPQFRLAAGESTTRTVESADPPVPERRSGFSLFGRKKATALFVYRTAPDKSSWTRAHEEGRRMAERAFDGRISTSAVYDISTRRSFPLLDAALAAKPDLLFTVNSSFAHPSVLITLENPDIAVFNCNHSQSGARLSTYFCKLYEQSFVMGAIAGAQTRTGILGYIDPPLRTYKTTYNINAFALGARLVNSGVTVKRCILDTNYSSAEDRLARGKLYEKGADVVFCQYPTDSPVLPKPGDDLYGMLCTVGPGGSVIENLAAPGWNWEVVYKKIIGDYLDGSLDILRRDGSRDGSNVHFWFGLSSGAINIYKVNAALGPHTVRLCYLLEQNIARSQLHPFIGPIRDSDGNLRVEKYDVPSLADIQSMDWLCDIVDETIPIARNLG